MMRFEVESKFRIANSDEWRGRIAAIGGTFARRERQTDLYFSHPARDFRLTDEALRVRDSNGVVFLTYKGPRGEDEVKTRPEFEVVVAGEVSGQRPIQELLERLGFLPVARIAKSRDLFELTRGQQAVLIALDEVERLGSFLEIEVIAAESDVEAARHLVRELSRELELGSPTKDSYLKMILTADDSRQLSARD